MTIFGSDFGQGQAAHTSIAGRSIVNSETPKRPRGSYGEDKDGDRRPEEQNRYLEEIARSFELAFNAAQNKLYSPS